MSIERLSPAAPQNPEAATIHPAQRPMSARESFAAYIVPATIGMVVMSSVLRQASPDISFSRRGRNRDAEDKPPTVSRVAAQQSLDRIAAPAEDGYDPLAGWTKAHRNKRLHLDGTHIRTASEETPQQSLQRVAESSGAGNIIEKHSQMRANLRADAILQRRAELAQLEALYGPGIGDKDTIDQMLNSGGRTFSEKRRLRLASEQHRELTESIEKIENRLRKQAGQTPEED